MSKKELLAKKETYSFQLKKLNNNKRKFYK